MSFKIRNRNMPPIEKGIQKEESDMYGLPVFHPPPICPDANRNSSDIMIPSKMPRYPSRPNSTTPLVTNNSPTLINPHRAREVIYIIRKPRHTHTIPIQHTLTSNRIQPINVHIRTTALYTGDPCLTSLPRRKRRASGAVIAEERVQTSSIHQNILAVQDAETPGCCAVS